MELNVVTKKPEPVKDTFGDVKVGQVFYARVRRTGARTDRGAYYLKVTGDKVYRLHDKVLYDGVFKDSEDTNCTWSFHVVESTLTINDGDKP